MWTRLFPFIIATAIASPASAEEPKPFTIGAAVAQTGFVTAFDQEPSRAAELAVKDINAAGGILGRPIKLLFADTKSDIAQGGVAAMELLDQGAELLIVTGDFDYGGMAARTANANGKIAISPFAADAKFGVEGIGPYAFTFATVTNTIGAALAEFASSKDWKTAYTLTQNNVQYNITVTKWFQERFKEMNGNAALVGEDTFSSDDTSIAAHITRIKALSPQPNVLVLSSHVPDGPSAIRQLRAAGLNMPILSAEAMDGDFWLQSTPNLSNFYYASVASIFGDDPRPEVKDFMKKFETEYGKRPSAGNVITGYTAVQAIKLAAERANSTEPDAMKAEFEKFKNENLLVGTTSFDEKTHINYDRPLLIMQVQNGKHSFLKMVMPERIPGR